MSTSKTFKLPTRDDLKPVVRGQNVTFQTSQGVLKLPLDIKTKVFKKVRNIEDRADAFLDLLDALGDKKASATIDEIGIAEFIAIVGCYFGEYEKYMAAIIEELPSSGLLGDEPGE